MKISNALIKINTILEDVQEKLEILAYSDVAILDKIHTVQIQNERLERQIKDMADRFPDLPQLHDLSDPKADPVVDP